MPSSVKHMARYTRSLTCARIATLSNDALFYVCVRVRSPKTYIKLRIYRGDGNCLQWQLQDQTARGKSVVAGKSIPHSCTHMRAECRHTRIHRKTDRRDAARTRIASQQSRYQHIFYKNNQIVIRIGILTHTTA